MAIEANQSRFQHGIEIASAVLMPRSDASEPLHNDVLFMALCNLSQLTLDFSKPAHHSHGKANREQARSQPKHIDKWFLHRFNYDPIFLTSVDA